MINTGNLYIVSAPSGAGKTSLLKALTEADQGISTSTSTTTREIRNGETDGLDYHFVSISEFNALKEQNDFLESAEVFGNFYGTSKQRVRDSLRSGQDLVLEIDWQGAQQIRKQLPEAISIFILPPSREELANRLKGRGQDNQQIIDKRMAAAIAEISHFNEYDFLVINDDFELALQDLRDIVNAHRLNQKRQSAAHKQLIGALL